MAFSERWHSTKQHDRRRQVVSFTLDRSTLAALERGGRRKRSQRAEALLRKALGLEPLEVRQGRASSSSPAKASSSSSSTRSKTSPASPASKVSTRSRRPPASKVSSSSTRSKALPNSSSCSALELDQVEGLELEPPDQVDQVEAPAGAGRGQPRARRDRRDDLRPVLAGRPGRRRRASRGGELEGGGVGNCITVTFSLQCEKAVLG